MMKRTLFFGSIALLVILGCGGAGTNVTVAPDPLVTFINASSNSVGIDAMLNETTLATNIPFQAFSPKAGNVATFSAFEQGEYDVTVQENGNPESQAVEVGKLDRNGGYLLFAVGLVTPPNAELEKRLRPVLLQIDRTKPNGDKAAIFVFNALSRAPGFETPSIDFQNPGDTPVIKETDIAFAGLKGVLVDAGAQTFVARRNGTEFEVTPQTTFTFEGGKAYVALVKGQEGGTGAQAPGITFIEIQTK